MDAFNRKFVTQFPKVAFDYDVDLSRYCPTRKFYSDLRCIETYSRSVQSTYIFLFWTEIYRLSFSMLGHFTVRVITCFGVIL